MQRRLSPEFKPESAQLVLDQNYSVREAAQAMNVSKSAMGSWVHQLKQERLQYVCTFSPLRGEKSCFISCCKLQLKV